MAGLTSLFVTRDGSDNGTTPAGARHALGGLLTQAGGTLLDVREGVLADHGSANVVTGTAGMTFDVRAAAFVGQFSTAQGPWEGVNNATYNVATTAAPGSNSRYDVIWVRQHMVAGDGGADSDVVFEIGVTQGVVAASPSVPADGGGANQVPTGAVRLANALITTGMSATNTATITQVFNWTVARGGVLPIRDNTERTAITTPYEGQPIYHMTDDTLQVWNGSAWKTPLELVTTAWTAVTFTNSWVNLGSGGYQTVEYRKVGDIISLRGAMKSGTVNLAAFTLPAGFRPPAKLGFSVPAGTGYDHGFATLDSSGVFVVTGYGTGGSNIYVSLDSIQFSITA